MAHKDKIVAHLKGKYPKMQQTVIDFVADKLDGKVVTEADVETVVTAFNEGPVTIEDIAAQITKESDRRVTQALKDNKAKTTTTEKKGDDEKKPEATDSGNADDPMGKILAAIQQTNSRLDAIEKGKTVETATQKLHKRATDAKIPLHLVPAVDSEDGIDAAFEAASKAYEEVKQHLANEGFTQAKKPVSGTGGGSGTPNAAEEKAVKADISAFVNKQLAAKGITPEKTA